MSRGRRVVITGLGPACPLGIGIQPTWDALLRGESGIARIKAFDPAGLATQVGGELPEFNFADHIPKSYRKSVKVMARDIVIAVVAAYHAVKDANLKTKCIIDRGEAEGPPSVASNQFGANIGAGLICADLTELAGALATAADENGKFSLAKWGAEGMNNLTPLWLLKFLPNMLACHVTIVHDAQAPSNTITCGEASSHLAIGEAFRTIARGGAEVCICGGAESKINPMAVTRPLLFERLTKTCNDEPEKACKPFGRQADGSVAAEGGGLVILESLDHAKARGARIYAELVGFGAASAVESWVAPDTNGESIGEAIRKALKDASTESADVGLFVPFGTGVPKFDLAEAKAYEAVFGERAQRVPALALRGGLGTNGAGSGSVDFSAAAMCILHQTVPPSRNVDDPADGVPFRFATDGPIDAAIDVAVTTSYALAGGQCAALVIKRYSEGKKG